ncbi:MAG TPA: ABC transporter permease [Longimicrobiales bacterium]|nr:ABC transporter permease [Longimicrobiales bacterium]
MSQLRLAGRALLRSPAYSVIALLTLVLGLGMNTAAFSLVRSVLLAPLPYPDGHELVVVREVNRQAREMDVAWKNFVDWRDRSRAFSGLAAYSDFESTILGPDRPVRTQVAAVTEDFFPLLGVAPLQGRALQAQDHRSNAAPAVVVSHRFWQTHLGSSTERLLSVDGHDARVVGVLPPGLEFPIGTDVWYAAELIEQSQNRTAHNYSVIGRLRDNAPVAAAEAELDAITRSFRDELGAGTDVGDYFPVEASVATLHEDMVGVMRRPLVILFGTSLILLLVACVNLASTTLARVTDRGRELALRHALGASRGELVRLQLLETGLLAGTGALLAFGLAALVVQVVRSTAPAGLTRFDSVSLDGTVGLFTLALALLTALLAGLWPALLATRRMAGSLRGGSRTGTSRESRRAWRVLIGAEFAAALLLLVTSGLLVRSFVRVLEVDPGYRTSGVLVATVDPPESLYPSPDERLRYYEELHGRLRALAGVADVGLVSRPPLASIANGLLQVTGGPVTDLTGNYQIASDGYFSTLGIGLVRGRTFDERDRAGSTPVVVVSRSFADEAWPGIDPIGHQVSSGGMEDSIRWATVIGVVEDVRQVELTRDPRPTVYLSYRQRPFRTWSMSAALRPGAGTAAALIPAVREAASSIDPNVPVRFATMEQRLADTLVQRRFVLMVIGAFSALALLLSAIGVYGVVAYAVTRRRREIGIRLALGSPRRAVVSAIQRDTLVPAAVGAATGILAALALTRVLESLLYEVQPADPLTYVSAAAVLGLTAWGASLVPALRSMRVGPLETMRTE